MATNMPLFLRTQGDGMEKIEYESVKKQNIDMQPLEIHDRQSSELSTFNKLSHKAGIKTLGSAIKLIPQTVNKKKKDLIGSLKNKEPKFVPYEPYKAAVRPIVPTFETKTMYSNKIKPKDVVGIYKMNQENITSTSKTCLVESKNELDLNDKVDDLKIDWEFKSKVLESKMQTLKEENDELEKQLKFQVQVNGELKNLLVAAVGEDMETKVHVLTEDKLHLAQALLRSSESLSSHQEQTEWLAGQCEVWKSKFLASSVMVEELARWKAFLCQKVNEAQEALKKFLEEQKHIQKNILQTYENLLKLRDNFDLCHKKNKLSSCNVLDVCEENLKLTNTLIIRLLEGKNLEKKENLFLTKWKKTNAEKAAENVLANPNLLHLVKKPDAACDAVVGAAVTLSGELYLQCHPPKISCCAQCKGEIKLI